VKLADHFINYGRCLLCLNDSEHESPQNHIFDCQKKSEKIFHGEEDLSFFSKSKRESWWSLKYSYISGVFLASE